MSRPASSGPASASPSGSVSPARSGAPRPAGRYVARDPRTAGVAIPPLSARYANRVRSPERTVTIWPARTKTEPHPSRRVRVASETSRPVTATRRESSQVNRNGVPMISIPAASALLPTSALAAASACGSAAPDGGTPERRWPKRPRSCTVERTPDSLMRITAGRTAGGRRRGCAPVLPRPHRTSRGRSVR